MGSVAFKPSVEMGHIRSPLRKEISVQHRGVIDLSTEDFWKRYQERNTPPSVENVSVTVIMGSPVRDRINGKSCVLYFPQHPLAIAIAILLMMNYYLVNIFSNS